MTKSFRYVKDFEFPSDCGFTGSAGKTHVKGYARGGDVKPASARKSAPAMKYGGKMCKADGGTVDPNATTTAASTAAAPAAAAATPEPKYTNVAGRPDVVTNEQGQRLFVSRPAPTPVAATAPAPVIRKNRRQLKQEMRSKINALSKDSADYRNQREALEDQYEPQIKAAPRRATGGSVRKSYPTNKSEPLVNAKSGGAAKMGKVMGEFKSGELHSGSKSGPVVKSRKQAIAIGMSEARKAKK